MLKKQDTPPSQDNSPKVSSKTKKWKSSYHIMGHGMVHKGEVCTPEAKEAWNKLKGSQPIDNYLK